MKQNGFLQTKMMQEAKQLTKPKSRFRELITFFVLSFVVSFAQGFIVAPASAIFVYTDSKILNMLRSATIDFDALTERALELANSQPDWLVITTLFSTIVMVFGAIIYCKFIEKRTVASMGFRKKNAFLEYLVGIGIGLVLILSVVGVLLLLGVLKIESINSVSSYTIAAYFFAYLVQGAAEEVLIRGYYMTSLARSTSVKYAMVNCSILFSLMHASNNGMSILSFINLFMFGLLMSMYLVKRGNIWGICAIHSIWNFIQGNVFGLSVSGAQKSSSIFNTSIVSDVSNLTGGDFGIEASLVTTLVLFLAIGAVIMLKQNKNEIASQPPVNEGELNV